MTEFTFTEYFDNEVMRKRPYLKKEWCIKVVMNPIRSEPQENNRFRFWGVVDELDGRFLRVVTLEDRRTYTMRFWTEDSNHEDQILSGYRLTLH